MLREGSAREGSRLAIGCLAGRRLQQSRSFGEKERRGSLTAAFPPHLGTCRWCLRREGVGGGVAAVDPSEPWNCGFFYVAVIVCAESW